MNFKLALAMVSISAAPAWSASSGLVRFVCKQNFPATREVCEARLTEGQTKFLSAAAIEACMGASADPNQQLNCVAGTINKNYSLKVIADCRGGNAVADCLAKARAHEGEVASAAAPESSPGAEPAAPIGNAAVTPQPKPASVGSLPAAAPATHPSAVTGASDDPLAGLEETK